MDNTVSENGEKGRKLLNKKETIVILLIMACPLSYFVWRAKCKRQYDNYIEQTYAGNFNVQVNGGDGMLLTGWWDWVAGYGYYPFNWADKKISGIKIQKEF